MFQGSNPAVTTTPSAIKSYLNGGVVPPFPSASTLGGIESIACSGSHWISTISTLGAPSCTQPAFTDLTGAASAAQMPTPTASTLGGIESITCATWTWVGTISTSGVPSCTGLPSPTRAGDIIYWNGSTWVTLAGNNSGTQTLQENSSGVPSWASVAGTGTVTSVGIAADGGETTTGNCTVTTSGTCTVHAPGGSLNVLRNSGFSAWFHGCVGSACTITTAGGWCAEGVWVIPTGASVTCSQTSGGSNNSPFYAMTITGAASVTNVIARFVVESNQSSILSAGIATFQMSWFNNTGGSITPTIQTKYANNAAADNWGVATTDLAATNLQACAASNTCRSAYTLAVSNAAVFGYEFNINLGNNFSTNGKSATLLYFDARVSPGVTTGLNSNPPPPEFRDMESEIRWSERFYQTTYDNGVAAGTATHIGMVGTTGATSSNSGQMGNVFRTTMRCDPTVTFWDGSGNASKLSFWNGAAWTDNQGVSPVVISGSAGHKGFVFYNNLAGTNESFHYAADCTVSGG